MEDVQLILADGKGDILVNQGEAFLEEHAIRERLEGRSKGAGLSYMISEEAVEGSDLTLMLIHKDVYKRQVWRWRYDAYGSGGLSGGAGEGQAAWNPADADAVAKERRRRT